MQTAKLYRIILPVADIERATEFYCTIFGTPGKRVSPGRHYFKCGDIILACYDPIADGDGEQGGWKFHPFQYFYFSVPNLELIMEKIQAAGGLLDSGIRTMPWGERTFYARDPFGSRICFVDESTLFEG